MTSPPSRSSSPFPVRLPSLVLHKELQNASKRYKKKPESCLPTVLQRNYFSFIHDYHHGRETGEPLQPLHFEWSSRLHRKGGFPRLVKKPDYDISSLNISAYRWVGIDPGNISWWVAMTFLLGSISWCINGVWVFCFLADMGHVATDFEAWSAFSGGTLFFLGAILSYVECVNPDPNIDFGHEVIYVAKTIAKPTTRTKTRRKFGRNTPHNTQTQTTGSTDSSLVETWNWMIPPRTLLHPLSIAVLANVLQLLGATFFEVAVILGLSGVLPPESTASRPASGVLPWNVKRDWMIGYWGCQVYGAPGFILSGLMFMIEAQRKWYTPVLWGRGALGWHVGFWNAVGGIGFLLCGIFGIWRETSLPNQNVQKWGTAFSTFWGSWAFLIGSYVQYFESLNPHAA